MFGLRLRIERCVTSEVGHQQHILLDELARRQLNEILVEAGARLAGAFMRAGLVDELLLYQAPVILGSEARGLFDGLFLTELTDAPRWRIIDQRRLGPDTRIQLIKD